MTRNDYDRRDARLVAKVIAGAWVFYEDPYIWKCGALAGHYTSSAWRHCRGDRWEPNPPPVPILVRFKRWLIG